MSASKQDSEERQRRWKNKEGDIFSDFGIEGKAHEFSNSRN